jgi:hypothetical protein
MQKARQDWLQSLPTRISWRELRSGVQHLDPLVQLIHEDHCSKLSVVYKGRQYQAWGSQDGALINWEVTATEKGRVAMVPRLEEQHGGDEFWQFALATSGVVSQPLSTPQPHLLLVMQLLGLLKNQSRFDLQTIRETLVVWAKEHDLTLTIGRR